MHKLFATEEPKWLKLKPNVDDNWTSCLQTLGGHEELVTSVAFSTKGFLASASWDGTIKIWDATTGRERYTFKHIDTTAHSVTFSADGRYVAAGLGNIMTTIWDAVTGKELQTTRYYEYITSIALSTDGRYLAVGSTDQTIRIWDVFSNKEQQMLQGHWASISSVAFSTSNYLASGSYDKTIRIWDLTGKGHQILKGHTSPVRSISFSADGQYLMSGSYETVKVWDTMTGKELRTIKVDTINASSHVFSTDGQYFAFVKGHIIKIWNMKTGKEHQKLQGRRSPFLSIAFSANGDYLASGHNDHSVCIWEVAVGKERQTSLTQKTLSIALSTDGSCLASGGDDSLIRIWDTATGKEHQTLKGHNNSVILVAFSADGRYIASASSDGTIKIWDAVTGKRQRSIKAVYPDPDSSLVFSSNGSYLAYNELSTRIAIWDVNAGKIHRKIKEDCNHLNLFVFSADACYLAFADDGTSHIPRLLSDSDKIPIRIWDIGADEELRVFPGHSSWVTSIAFSPDNRYLASASMDGTIKIWDAKQGAELQTIKKETLIRTMSFDPKASYLLTETESLCLNLEHQPSLASPAANLDNGQVENKLIVNNIQNRSGTGYGISLDTCWVTWNGLGILWLPPEYRSTRPIIRLLSASASSQFPMADVLIALRSRSGRCVMMRMSGSGPYST
jgi:WD40 repeat protein